MDRLVKKVKVTLVFVLILLVSAPSLANCPFTEFKFVPENVGVDHLTGSAVAISSNGLVAAVGALEGENPNDPVTDSGVVYLLEMIQGQWLRTATLTPSDVGSGFEFGTSLAISDNCTLAVGAPRGTGNQAGAVYVFEKDSLGNMVETAKLVASSPISVKNGFGTSATVAISNEGQRILVGAPTSPNGDEKNRGFVYVFDKDVDGNFGFPSPAGQVENAIIQADDLEDGDRFGTNLSLSTDGNFVLVGSPRDDDGGIDAGAAYLFEDVAGVWTQQAKLVANDPVIADRFGTAVALSSNGVAVIGAPFADKDDRFSIGAAYVFKQDAAGVWFQEVKIFASDGESGDRFGEFADITSDGQDFIISAIGADSKNPLGDVADAGAAYAFEALPTQEPGVVMWVQVAKFTTDVPVDNADYGRSLSLSDDNKIAIVGSPQEGGEFSNSGAAYVFSLSLGLLGADFDMISVVQGGTQTFSFCASPEMKDELAGCSFIILGSASGLSMQGTVFGNPGSPNSKNLSLPVNFDTPNSNLLQLIPIVVDDYFHATLQNPNSDFLPDGNGVLDSEGRAQARLIVPGATSTDFINTVFNHVMVIYDGKTGDVKHVTNSAPLTLVE